MAQLRFDAHSRAVCSILQQSKANLKYPTALIPDDALVLFDPVPVLNFSSSIIQPTRLSPFKAADAACVAYVLADDKMLFYDGKGKVRPNTIVPLGRLTSVTWEEGRVKTYPETYAEWSGTPMRVKILQTTVVD